MPIPTAEIYDKEQQNSQTSTSSGSNPSRNTSSSENSYSDSENLVRSDLGSSAADNEGQRTLSREEADRLYEERMEEEYAKRDGGA